MGSERPAQRPEGPAGPPPGSGPWPDGIAAESSTARGAAEEAGAADRDPIRSAERRPTGAHPEPTASGAYPGRPAATPVEPGRSADAGPGGPTPSGAYPGPAV